MQRAAKPAKLAVKNGWIICPVCKQRTHQHVGPNVEAKGLELWCHRCKTVHVVNIVGGQCFLVSPCR
ncbi:cysteine-rich KTR domain-containing protein [uncultured Oscillibacter sp.]|uniref:cysteine-rich KTR domain-containing protein n=1 Tax=uncultured Oscillibacter sp. TaxID=876091 RepID=UPI003452D4F3